MSIPLEALVGELHISGGVRQSTSRPTASFVAPRRVARGRAGDLLFVLVELRGPDPLPFRDLVDRIEAAYWRTPGTVTSALRAALAIANDWLMDRNVQLEVTDRLRAGVSCAVLREAQVWIAQAGPAAAYVAHHGQVERFPARQVTAPAMGASRGIEVRFSRAALSPGDVLLLCDSDTAERTADQAIAEAIVYTGVQAALQNLEKLAGSNDLIALVIEGAAERKTKAAIPPPQPSVRPAPSLVPEPPVKERLEPTGVPATQPPTVEAGAEAGAEVRIEADKARWEQRMDERSASLNRGPRAGMAEPIKPPEPQVKAGRPPEAEAAPEVAPAALARRQSGLADRLRPRPAVQPEIEAEVAPATVSWRQRLGERVAELGLGERARAIGGSLRAGGIVAARGLATVLQRTLPEGVVPQQRGKAADTVLITFAVVIPLVVLVLVAVSYKQHSTLDRFQSLLSSARSEAAQAATLQDPAAQRALWASSLEQAQSALAIFPQDADAHAARDDAQRALDRIDNVVRLAPTLLWDCKSPGPHRLAAQGVNLFVLDRAVNRVFQLTLNESGDAVADPKAGEPPTRAYKSQAVSERQVGDLIDLVWMPESGTRTRSSLLILDSGGLLDYDLAWNLRAVALGQGAAPAGARAIAAFGGNLYVLDAGGNQLWRYKPQGDGYGGTPESYFDKPLGDLGSALDMAIDGNVYLLLADGRIRKFFGGAEKDFAVAGLNEPLKKPVALAVDAEARNGSVYVIEAGRVVQFNPDGAFIRQFRADGDAFDALEDLVVDENGERMFVMSGGKLYVTHIPALP
jgi:hypothetical protein